MRYTASDSFICTQVYIYSVSHTIRTGSMKIAFVYDVLYPDTIGGVEKRIYEIGTRLARRGHEVHLFPMATDPENDRPPAS